MKEIEDIKSEVEAAVNTYFESEAKAVEESGMFGKITGKLRASKEILETVGQRSIDILNKYHEDLTEDQVEDLLSFTRELLPTAYKRWFLNN
ncbi:MAG: hypothetical protein AAF620_01315 [Bacteroidota bacterium]